MNRINKINSIRKNINSGQISLGGWMQIPHPSVAEIMGSANYDWVAVDMEHGSISIQQLPDIFRALELGDTLPLARLSDGNSTECKRVLDAGAGGVIVPMIETADQLCAIRDACRWPPSGNRGVGFSRANLFGKHFETYKEEAQAPLLIAMIENTKAVSELNKILKVKDLDALLIGPYDLSASMGITAQFDHEVFIETMTNIRILAKEANVPLGIHVVEPCKKQLKRRIDEGFQFLPYSIDSVMLRQMLK